MNKYYVFLVFVLFSCNNLVLQNTNLKRSDFDKNDIVQHVSVNTLDTGRNANEVLRTLEAIKAGGLTGCEWIPGDDFVA